MFEIVNITSNYTNIRPPTTLHWFYHQLMHTTMATADRKFSDPHISRLPTFKVKNCQKFSDLYAKIYVVLTCLAVFNYLCCKARSHHGQLSSNSHSLVLSHRLLHRQPSPCHSNIPPWYLLPSSSLCLVECLSPTIPLAVVGTTCRQFLPLNCFQ